MDKPIRPSGATRMATPNLYERDEWMEITHEVYDFFAMHPELPDDRLVNAYGFYHRRMGRVFVCISTSDDEWITAVSCMNMTESDFTSLAKADKIDDVIIALGYAPAPTISTSV